MNTSKRAQTWNATKIPNLFLLRESGVYYGRVKPKGGRQIRQSFRTKSFTAAKGKLRDWLISLRVAKRAVGGTWGGLIEPYRVWLQGKKITGKITDSTIGYKLEQIDNMRTTWDKFDSFKLSGLTEKILAGWQIKHRSKYSATRTNGATTVIREMIAVAVRDNILTKEVASAAVPGLRYVKVKYDYKRMLNALPEPPQVIQLREEIYRRCQRTGTLGGWLFDFLLFSGSRIEAAGDVRWEDIKWSQKNGNVHFRTAKYGPYDVPLFRQLRELLEKIKTQYPNAKPNDQVLPSHSLQTVLSNACATLNLTHLSHHDLRHLFATRCIESGVDIPTVAKWLGHKDGGRTAMMIYGHVREAHSQGQARTIDFLPQTGPQETAKEQSKGQQKKSPQDSPSSGCGPAAQ